MTKTLVRHGNSLALVLDKPILELLKIKEKTPLEITSDGKRLLITPARSKKSKKELEGWLVAEDKAHGEAYSKLSKPE